MANRNYYDILGVTYKATPAELTAAKNKLAKLYHPDVNMRKGIDTTDKMQEVLEAYAVLSDKEKRAEYDRELRGTTSIMQTFDLSKTEDTEEDITDSGFVLYWKTSNELYELLSRASALYKHKSSDRVLKKLAHEALKHIFILRSTKIPEKYWHPEIMNWLLLQSYKNRNYTPEYLVTLYENHLKKDLSLKDRLSIQKMTASYQHSLKKLMKY